MLNFKSFIKEAKNSEHAYHVEMHLMPNHYPIYRFVKTKLHEVYRPDEGTLEDGEIHKTIGTFNPSSLDHDTITNEFHDHLHKHGYYMHTPTHPMVLSPRENHFKSDFKKFTQGRTPAHEQPHRDEKTGITMGRYVGVWSTQGPTKIYTKDSTAKKKTEIPGATQPNKVTIFNDSELKHAASGEKNRWFIRAGEIRKIPPGGIVSPNKKGEEVNYGHDVEAYKKDKLPYAKRHVRDVREHFKNASPEQQHKTAEWLSNNYPEYHPDKLGIPWHGSQGKPSEEEKE